MAGKITTLYEDSAKTIGIFPRTKVSAVSDENGTTLDTILSSMGGGSYTTCILPSFSGAGSQNVAISGITSDSHPTLDIYIPTTNELVAYSTDWSKIYRADTYDGGITFYASGAVTGGETIIVKGF